MLNKIYKLKALMICNKHNFYIFKLINTKITLKQCFNIKY